MKIINAGVTAPKGFKCAGLRAGVKPGKTNKDMAMIVSEVPAKIAGTFTKNIVKAAPVLWGKKIVEEQEAVRAVVINTGIANACTGAQGYENVDAEAASMFIAYNFKRLLSMFSTEELVTKFEESVK